MQTRPERLYRGVFLVSLGTLLYQIALIRVLSFTIWYHFAYVVISTALLGFGASGTLLAVRPGLGAENLERTLGRVSVLSGLTGAGFLGFMSAAPFDPMAILASPTDLVLLVLYQLLAAVPFFFAGLAVSLALRAGASQVDRLYFWDLLGAAVGCAASVAVMNTLGPPGALLVACACLVLSAQAFTGARLVSVASLLAAALLAAGVLYGPHVPLTPAASKHFAQHVGADRMALLHTRWTALFRTDVLSSTAESPFGNKDEWGLSLNVPYEAQKLWGSITHDGSAGAPLYDLRAGKLDFLDDHLLRFPYLVARPAPRVLVIGVGGGRDVFTALRYGAAHVTAVELDPATAELVKGPLLELSDGVFGGPRVELVVAEGRHFIERSRELYDVIQITGVDTLAAQTSGAYVLAENFLYTTQAFHAYLEHLAPGGVLSIATGEWNAEYPQMTGRMTLVARQALEERGLSAAERLAVFHSFHLLTNVLVRNEPFSPAEVARLDAEAGRLAFLPLWLPGGRSHAKYAALVTTEGEERAELLRSSRYVLDPVTDDHPFFFRFHRWRDLLDAPDFGPFLASALGQILLLVLLVSLTLLGAVFIVIPLFVLNRRGLTGSRGATLGILVYFLALGFGFMLLEISLMQRFVLYLGYPTYALSVVLLSLLFSLGIGSYLSRRWVGRERTALPAALGAVVLLVLAYRAGLVPLFAATLGLPLALRVAITVALLLPLGIALGTFFPLGIRRAAAIHPDLVPWAWGINGCASVTASVLAVVIGMEFGFVVVWVLSLVVYAVGVVAFLALSRGEPSASAPSG